MFASRSCRSPRVRPCHDGSVAVSRRAVAIFVMRWIVTLAMLVALVYGARQLFDTARQRGAQEAADDVRRSTGPGRRATTTSTAASAVSTAAAAGPTTTVALAPSGPVDVATVEASDTERDLPDSCGRPVNYDVRNLVDGNTTTAWRAPGDAVGARVTITLPRPTHLTQIGLVPGYAKVDQCSNLDRFTQLRRVTAVEWLFDGEVSLPQTFKDRPEMQTMAVDVITTTITIEIRGSTPNPRLDAAAISEVQLVGAAAG